MCIRDRNLSYTSCRLVSTLPLGMLFREQKSVDIIISLKANNLTPTMLNRQMLAENGFRFPIESPDLKLYHSRLTASELFVAGCLGTDPENVDNNFAWELPTTPTFSLINFSIENREAWDQGVVAPRILRKRQESVFIHAPPVSYTHLTLPTILRV